MNDKLQPIFADFAKKILAFSPTLLGGAVLLVVGWVFGWFAKRLIIQFALLLRLERFLVRFSWGQVFSRADVRYGLYRFLGNIAFAVVFLIFLELAFVVWNLKLPSDFLAAIILLLPKGFAAGVIFYLGWVIALKSAKSVQATLAHQKIPGSRSAGYFVRASLMVFFSAMALVQLNIAREIVVVGFVVAFATLGLIAVVMIFFLGKELAGKMGESEKEEGKRD